MTARLVFLLLLAGLGAAQEAETPLIFFREPDAKTERLIRDEYISARGKGLASGTRDERTAARRRLEDIGAWAVPPLSDTIAGRRRDKADGIRRNAIMVLARILDPRCLPALREVAAKDERVRPVACLALGLFRKPEDRFLLQKQLDERGDRGAAFALAKLRDENAASILVAVAHNPPRDEHVAAAALLAAAVASPVTKCHGSLDDKEDILRRTAATGLLIRPLPASRAAGLIELLGKPGREDNDIRALQIHALGYVPARTAEIRELLLKLGTSISENNEPRVAALIELASEWGVTENYPKLRGFYRTFRGRNDPALAACLFAMARTGEPKAVDDLLKVLETQSPWLQFYAAGSLLHQVVHFPQEHPREEEIFAAIERLRKRDDKALTAIVDLAFELRLERDADKRRARAREGFARIDHPQNRQHFWDWSRSDRAWALVNQLVPRILELDDIEEKGGGGEADPADPMGGQKGQSGADPAEQDLLDFLKEKPYFGPEDLGG